MSIPTPPLPGAPPPEAQPALAPALPPEVLHALLAAMPPDVRAQFGTLPPVAQNRALVMAAQGNQALLAPLLAAAEAVGLIPPDAPAPPGQGPLPPAPDMPPPMPGGLPNGPAPQGFAGPGPLVPLPPGVGPEPGVPVPPLAGSGAGRPHPVATPAPKPTEPELPDAAPPPDDWEPESLDDLKGGAYGRRYAWDKPPTWADLTQLADDALKARFWQERNQACYDQAWTYYRSRDFLKMSGQPWSQVEGDLIYILSTPAKQVDRIVARAKASPDHLKFSLEARSEREEYQDARQDVEDWTRGMWDRHIARWWDRLSRTGPDAALDRKLTLLGALHGTCGWALRPDVRRRKGARKRDLNADYPLALDLIPWHELYQLGDCTLRIQRVDMREARRMCPEVRARWPVRKAGEQGTGVWYPSDEHTVRIIGFSDEHGIWFAQCFDVCPPARTGNGGPALPADDERECWLVKPDKPINYGFCLYEVPPGWQSTGDNALPDDRNPAGAGYGRHFARGVLFTSLEDYAVQDQSASYSVSAFRYNRDPAAVETIDAQLRAQLGETSPPDPMRYGERGRNLRYKGEGAEFIAKHFADNSADNFFLSLIFGQTADTFPAALGGGGSAQSGYDRAQMVENAQLLHVEELRDWVARTVESIARRQLELLYRLSQGKGKLFDALPFRRGSGKVGEGKLDARAIERAGVDVRVTYWEEDLDKELHLNNIYIPRLKESVISMETTRDRLGVANPALEEQRVDEEMGLGHPALKEARARFALVKGNNPLLPFFEDALLRQRAQDDAAQAAPGPQLPSMPGVPSGRGGATGVPPGMAPPVPVPGQGG